MDNSSDKFEITKKLDFENIQEQSNNFFIKKTLHAKEFDCAESYKRINDYDLNILQEDAYKKIDDELFKLEYKISKIEQKISTLHSQLQAAKDISDYNLVSSLEAQKIALEKEYSDLISKYNEKSLSARLTESLSNVLVSSFKKTISKFTQHFALISDVILSKLPTPFVSAIKLKKSLIKLRNINKSFDELISTNSPLGEDIDKYEQLSKYIIRANDIQSQVKKYMKN